MISALVFDCFGVLYRGSRTYLYDKVPTSRHRELTDLNHASDRGYVSYADYVRQASELAGCTPDELTDIFRREHIRNDELVDYIRTAKLSYKTALLSNVGPSVMEQLFPASEQAELFDVVVLSCDVGSTKPHPAMYETALEQLDVPARAAIMIDDIAENVRGAEAVGMHGVEFAATNQALAAIDAIIRKEA